MKPGIAIGNYVLDELLDQGGTSQLWLAYRELAAGGRTAVAIKFPYAAGALDPRVRDGLNDEARLQMQLQHSNIPRVIDLGLHEGLPYFVMDYIAGHSLAELLVSLRVFGAPLRFELVAHIAREIGYALRYAHGFQLDGVSRPVLHRAVAPENVLLSGQGAVYVVDFGIAEAAGIHVSSTPAKNRLLYMAPEHALGFPTPKSDGWGLGAIMWEMIEGRPFRAEVEADDLPRAAKQGRHGPLAREGIPEVLQLVTEGLLCVDDGERLTLDEALRQLEAPELPVQRMALADVLKDCFGDSPHRPGRSWRDSDPAEHPDRPLAAAKVIADDGPFGLNAWSVEPEDDALPPPPAWASMDDDPVDAGAEPVPSPSGAHEAEDVRASEDDASESHEETRPPTHDTVAPMLAVLDLHESSSSVMQKPAVPSALDTTPPTPAVAPRRGWSAAVLVPVLGLAIVGLAWAGWPRGTDQEAIVMPAPAASSVTVSAVQPMDDAEANGEELAVGPTEVEPAPTVGPEPAPTVDPAPVTSDPAPTDAPVTPEPVPTVEPKPEPKTKPSGEPKASTTPPRKKTGPPVPLTITLLLMADMELEIDGKLFSLGLRKTSAKTSVTPGTVRVRWRRPLGKWKSKKLEVEPGAKYEVLLDDRGPALKRK
jgi:serine/threonine protein kinase